MSFLDTLTSPPREYTPIPFWFLNGDLTAAELRRQLRDFCAHGVWGVVLHPRIGIPERIGYLSAAFFDALRPAVDEARALGMKIVLYDEGMYPSGSAGGLVVQGHPELASRGIALTDRPLPGDRVLAETPEGLLVERFSGGTIRGIHFGEDDGEPHAPPSADILNPEAVARFIRLTHEAYARAFGADFGETILGFFTDEPSILGRNTRGLFPWSRDFDQLFTKAGGRLEHLAALFSGGENPDTALYHQLILRRESEVYYGALSRWCEAHGLALMGHPHQSDDIEVLRWFHIPGQDLVFRWVSPEKGGTAGMDSTMAKCSADMARLTGRRRNANECFGACNRDGNPWHFTGADMKWTIDWLTVRGVNLLIPHAFYYSLEGPRCQERPPDVGPGSIWWPHWKRWADYITRLCCLRTETRQRADIAVLCRNRELRAEAVAPLFETQRGFQYLPESEWRACREEDGELLCRGMRFRAVLGDPAHFPSVSHDPWAVPPDCRCDPPQPSLRAAALEREGTRLWLLVNEGDAPIAATLTLPTGESLGAMDLWTGTVRAQESRPVPGGRQLTLRLGYRESLLLFTCDAPLPPPAPDPERVLTGSAFTLAETDAGHFRKIYTARVSADGRDLLVRAEAEEMAELFVNGVFCDVSFWTPHALRVPAALLGSGDAELRLVITGSPANRYGRPVPYGLV